MRVVQAIRFGGPEVLVPSEVPDPVAGPGQVVIRVAAVGILFVETQVRRGLLQGYFDVKPPYIPGNGVAGQVLSVGQGVDSDWIGRQVFASTGDDGGYAEQTAVPMESLVGVPAGLDLREAAALIPDADTALALLDAARISAGQWVLITAAAGGLGSLLVQLVRAVGGRVVAAVRGKEKLDLVRDLGAEVVVDYSESDWLAQVSKAVGDRGVDVVFDGVGGKLGSAAFEVTAHGGQFSAHGAPSGGFAEVDAQEAERRGVTVRGIEQVRFTPERVKQLTERALTEAAAGRFRPVIGQTFPLDKAADAHAAIEARKVIGRVLLLTG